MIVHTLDPTTALWTLFCTYRTSLELLSGELLNGVYNPQGLCERVTNHVAVTL